MNKKNHTIYIIFPIVIIVLIGLFIALHHHPKVYTGNDCKATGAVVEKPVIYLYGYNNINVKVKLTYDGEITSTYPKYSKTSGWSITATKNGTLKDSYNRSYNYLFWEGRPTKMPEIKQGVCIKGSETETFLEDSLKTLGLADKEAEDFITYWLPRMQNNKYNVISFLGKEYTDTAKLTVTPKPDTMIRICMAWYPSDKQVNIKEQALTSVKRPSDGTYLVEWGGYQLNKSETEITEEEENEGETEDASLETKTNNIPSYRNKTPLEMTLEENNLRQQELLVELAELQQAVLIKQTIKNNSNPYEAVGGTVQNAHPFTDKNGHSTTFTASEWQRLLSLWAYTGRPEEYIATHTVDELRRMLQ